MPPERPDTGGAAPGVPVAAIDPWQDPVEETVDLDGCVLSILRPRDAESLIDEEAFARDEFLPYWAELWPSAIALARRLTSARLEDCRVLELGCGLGLPSIAAARAGATAVATDWSKDALDFARANAERNGALVQTRFLRWDEPGAALRLAPLDLVLAADVLYEPRNAPALLELLPQVLAPGGRAILTDPGRRHAAAFLGPAALRWRVETEADPLLPRGGVHHVWIE